MQTLNTFMKYFSPIKCHKLIYLLIYVDFLNTCSGRWHFQLASHIGDRTTHRPIKIHLIKNLKAKRRQPIGCDIAFRQIENITELDVRFRENFAINMMQIVSKGTLS